VRLRLFAVAAALALPLMAIGQTVSAVDEIRAARRASNDALKRHDIEAFGASLDPELVVVTGGGTFVPSRQAYMDRLAKDFTNPDGFRFERTADTVDLGETGVLAAEHGHWVGFNRNGSRGIGGTYLAMWRKTDKGWKIRSELFVLLNCFDMAACEQYRKPS